MDEQTRAEVLRTARALIEFEMREPYERHLDNYWEEHQWDAETGCWFPYDKLKELEFDGDTDLVKNIWSESRIQKIDSGSDPTEEEVRQWHMEYGRRAIRESRDDAWQYIILPIRSSLDVKAYVLLTEPRWYSFDGSGRSRTVTRRI